MKVRVLGVYYDQFEIEVDDRSSDQHMLAQARLALRGRKQAHADLEEITIEKSGPLPLDRGPTGTMLAHWRRPE